MVKGNDARVLDVFGPNFLIETNGTVGVGGLILCKIPVETANERNAHFERQTENQMRAVDNDLMREENPAMPMTRERKTQVSFGKGRG